MSKAIDIAENCFLQNMDLTESQLCTVLGQLQGGNIDYADLYFQSSRHESWVLEDNAVKNGSFSIDMGVGVRACGGEKTGFAYSDDIVFPALVDAANAARCIVKQGQNKQVQIQKKQNNLSCYSPLDPLASMDENTKIRLLKLVNDEARASDPRICEVIASLAGSYEIIMILGTDGTYRADIRPLVRMNATVIVEDKNGRREQVSSGGGGRFDYSYFTDDIVKGYAKLAVKEALMNLEAIDAPAGTMPVVLGSGWPGVLLHEAVGHGLEGDFNRKGTSAFAGRLGERVASPLCTVLDDGTLEGRRGSLSIDDEGVDAEATVLIENGILKNYMQDKLNAKLMGMKPTGNGRRESFAHLPMPRMTNTYMLAGQHSPEEIIKSVKKGLYAANFAGGQVDITNGKFVFSTSEAYLIEDGKITAPVKGATLIGDGPSVMQQISMVGNDLALDPGIGICGKNGQSVPVGVGQPTLKIDSITVGGTK